MYQMCNISLSIFVAARVLFYLASIVLGNSFESQNECNLLLCLQFQSVDVNHMMDQFLINTHFDYATLLEMVP